MSAWSTYFAISSASSSFATTCLTSISRSSLKLHPWQEHNLRVLSSQSATQAGTAEEGSLTESTEHLLAGIDAALASARLSTWEQNFLRDIQSRYRRYGDRAHLSEKQRNTLYRILGRSLPSSPPVQIRLRPVPKMRLTHPAQGRSRPPFLQREARRWGRRLARDTIAAAAVALLFGLFMALGSISSLWQSSGETRTSSSPTVSSHAPPHFSVTDGDTIRISGDESGTRLVGFNTPEKFSPQCAREEQLGHRATARLRELVTSPTITLTKVACSCRPGTHGTKQCNYGRSCAILKVEGRNVGDILISEGLAVPFVCGSSGCPSTPRPWCG